MTARSSLNQRNARGHRRHRRRLQFGECRIVHLSPTFNCTRQHLTTADLASPWPSAARVTAFEESGAVLQCSSVNLKPAW
jgi:hypothetical protein